MKRSGQHSAGKFRRDRGDEIEGKPCSDVFAGNEQWAVLKHICLLVEVGNKEGENNVSGKKTVHHVVNDSKGIRWFIKKPKLKGANKCSVKN